MKFRKSPIALAALAVCSALPFAAQAAPSVSWAAPLNGATLRGTLSGTACAANTSSDATRVTFWATNWQINNDYSPPFNCSLDTTRLADGNYTLRAVAYDASGASSESDITVTIANNSTSTPTSTSTSTTTSPTTSTTTSTTSTTATPAPGSGSLDVWFKAPLNGATISGVLPGGTSCYVNGTGVSQVAFFLDNAALNTDSTPADGMQCALDTTKFANGTHQLRATAYDASGNARNDIISVNVQNAASTTSTSSSTTTTPTTTTSPTTSTTTSPTTSTATSTTTTTVSSTTATPAPGSGSLDVWFKSPLSGATVSGVRTGTSCYVNGTGVSRVAFFLDNTALNTDTAMADGMQCVLDTTKFANGTHQLKATAYDASGNARNDVISINVQNAATAVTTSSTTTSPTSSTTTVALGGVSTGTTSTTTSTTPTSTTSTSTTSTSTSTGSTPAPGSGSLDVWFKSPASGATISGALNGGTKCYVNGTGDVKVAFFLDNTALNTDTTMSDGMQCTLDTTKFANGTHQLKATAYDASGNSRNDVISVNVQNAATATSSTSTSSTSTSSTSGTTSTTTTAVSATPTTTTTSTSTASTAIAAADILAQAQANVPFAQQSGYNGQVLGQYPAAKDIPETGVNGPTLSNGETLRLGKQPDPMNSSRNAFAFQVAPNDTLTSGSHRSEFEMPPNIALGKTYWIAYSAYINDWGTLSSGDDSLFGTQVHNGNSNLGLSPSFTIYTSGASGGRTMQIYRQYNTSSSPTQGSSTIYRSPEIPIPFGRWIDFVFKFREAIDGSGLLQIWMDGNQIMDYSGPLGYSTPGYLDYAKFGYYNWSSFNTSRKVLLRSPVLVNDPTGSTYQATDLRSFVQQNQ